MKRIPIYIAALLVLAGCNSTGGRTGSAERAPIAVKVQEITDVSSAGIISYVGTAEAVRSTVISAPNAGRLVSLSAGRGDRVSAGQVLGQIESQTVRSTWQMAQATLSQAEDGYERAWWRSTPS